MISSKTTIINSLNRVNYIKRNIQFAFDSKSKFKEFSNSNYTIFLNGKIYSILNNEKLIKFNKKNLFNLLTDHNQNLKLVKKIQNSLEGHYNILIINNHNNNLLFFSDKFSKKDLYYYKKNKKYIISDNLESLIENIDLKIDYCSESLISMFLVYGNYAPKKHTIYKNIYRLGVNEFFQTNRGLVNLKKFDYDLKNIENYSDDKLDDYYNRLYSSIKIRSSNVMNWVYLSSGWDSSAILAYLTKIKGNKKVSALIARFKYSKSSGINNQFEVDRASKLAKYFKVKIYIIDIDYTKKDFKLFWDKIKNNLKSNHLYVMNNYNYMQLANFVKKKSKIKNVSIFNGEISDGLHNFGFAQFASILEHPDYNFREYSDKMSSYFYGPTFFKEIINNRADDDFIYQSFKTRHKNNVKDTKKLNLKQRKLYFLESFFCYKTRFPFINIEKSKMITKLGMIKFRKMINENYFSEISNKMSDKNIYSCLLNLYNSFHWQGGTVKGFTNASNYYSLSSEMPFWDTRLFDFLSKMPEHWGRGLDFNPTKYPLKWTLNNKIKYPIDYQVGPHSYLYDIDPNWNADVDIIYGSYLSSYFKKILKERSYLKIMDKKYFNHNYINKIVDDYCSNKKNNPAEITDIKNLISLSLIGWY